MDDSPDRLLPMCWPQSPPADASKASGPATPHARMQRAKRRGESAGDGWMLFFAVLIGVGYGALFLAGVAYTWLKWPVLGIVLFMLWRHWPRRRGPATRA